jgi:hypothetical protein
MAVPCVNLMRQSDGDAGVLKPAKQTMQETLEYDRRFAE